MADRSVSVRMVAEVDQYRRDMASAAAATGSIGTAAAEAGRQTSAIEQLGAAAGEVGRGLATVAGVAAAGVAAIGVSALRSGAAYNILEQQSRAALSTLMGSTEAAEAQMDDLREFVETRLFPREVFIEAQQQMLAFGFAAESVIPTLGTLEDAVAATGGTAQTFSEVVGILARVQSTGQVTAESLNELARRGINAAQLIGQAMGKTENEIRDSITRGALDGREAIELLIESMSGRFAGGAEALTQTWVGASGLVSAGLRNIGSAATEAFIDPAGGGAAIQWAKDVAEVLYAVHRQLVPLVAELRQRAAPGIERVSGALQGFAETIDDLDLVSLVDQVSAAAPAFAALGGAVTAAGSAALLRGIPGIGGMAAAFTPLTGAVLGVVAASPELREALSELLAALMPLLPVIAETGTALATVLSTGLSTVAELLLPLAPLVELLVNAFQLLPEPVQQATVAVGAFALALRFGGPAGAAVAALATLGAVIETFGGQSAAAQTDTGRLVEDLERLNEHGRVGTDLWALFGDGITEAGENADFFADVIEKATEHADMMGRSHTPEFLQRAFTPALLDATERVEELDEALAAAVLAGADADELLRSLAQAYDLSDDQLADLVELLPEYSREAERQAERTRDAADEQGEFADETDRATAALRDQMEEIRAQVDPMFALHQALRDLQEAQSSYDDVLADSESTQGDVSDAALALADAALEVQGAVGDAAGAFDGELDPAFRATLESAGLTERQIDQVEQSFRDATAAGEDFAQDYEARVEVEGLGSALSAATALQQRMASLHGTTSTLHVDVTGAGGLVVPDFHTGGRVPGRRGGEVLANLAADEHVWTPQEVQAAGGHAAMEAMRASVLAGESRFASSASGGSGPVFVGGGGGELSGDLYLSTGEFLGVVRGVVHQESSVRDRRAVRAVRQGAELAR